MPKKIKKHGANGLYQMISDRLNGALTAQVVANYTSVHGWKADTVDDVDGWVEAYKTKIGAIDVDDEEVEKAKRLSIVSKGKIDAQKALQEIENTKKKKQEALKSKSDAKKVALQVKIIEGNIIEVADMEYCFIQIAEIVKNSLSNLRGELPNSLYGLEKKAMLDILTEKFDAIQNSLAQKTASFVNESRSDK